MRNGTGRRRRIVLAVLPCAVLVACAGPAAPTPVPTIADSTAPTAPPTGQEPAGPTRAVPVYYVGATDAGPRLFREFHPVATDDPAGAAVREMLAAPVGTDPDYRTFWPAGTALRAPITHDGGVFTVDFTAAAAGSAGAPAPPAEQAGPSVQQLVYTVQAATQRTDPVRVLVEGRPVERLWGLVDTAGPVARGDQYAVRSLVQIDAPAHGATVPGTFEVTGEAAAFEATVRWEVRKAGAVVASGFATAAEGQRFSPFRFPLTLEPGTYEVRVSEDDPSDGEGRPPLADDKQVTVPA